MTKSQSIIVIANYFGRWPVWINFFMESCRRNPSIDWLIYTDCGLPENLPPNVSIRSISFQDYLALVSSRLEISFTHLQPYKLTEVKPMLGFIHEPDIGGYDFWAHCDFDLVFGDIRAFYTSHILDAYDVISSHENRVSGHFALYRNNKATRNIFRKVKDWKKTIENPEAGNFDEWEIGRFLGAGRGPRGVWRYIPRNLNRYRRRAYFKEQYSTPYADIDWIGNRKPHPDVWFWRDGIVTNADDGDRRFLYFHFMNLKYARFLPQEYAINGKSAWELLDSIVHIDWREAAINGFQIGPQGITALP